MKSRVGGEISHFYFVCAVGYLGDDGGDDGSCALARTVGVEWTRYYYREVESVVETLCQSVSPDFCGGVGRLRLTGMFLIYWYILSCAVDFARRCDYDAVSLFVTRGLQHVEGPFDVGVYIAVGGYVAVWYRNQGGEVKHRPGAACYVAAEVRVAHIAAHHFKAVVVDVFKPSPRVERVVLSEGSYPQTLVEQCFGEVRAYESVGPGDEYRLVCVYHK